MEAEGVLCYANSLLRKGNMSSYQAPYGKSAKHRETSCQLPDPPITTPDVFADV